MFSGFMNFDPSPGNGNTSPSGIRYQLYYLYSDSDNEPITAVPSGGLQSLGDLNFSVYSNTYSTYYRVPNINNNRYLYIGYDIIGAPSNTFWM